MNIDATTRAPARSVTTALTENVAALVAQMSVALLGFIDAWFMGRLGVELLAAISYVNGFTILVNASVGGALQAFLIVGGGRLGSGDKRGFAAAARAALRVATLLSGVAHLVMLAVIGVLSMVSESAPRDAVTLALMLMPSVLLNAMCLVLRLKVMLLKAPALLVTMSLVLICAKFVALVVLFRVQPFTAQYPFVALAGSGVIAALICLMVSWSLDRRYFRMINRQLVERHDLALLTRQILAIGLPIGAVIVLEMSVFGVGQMIQTLLGTLYGAAFGLVTQFVLLAQTIAVAIGQVTTINVSIAVNMRHRGSLLHAVTIGVVSTALIHGLLAALAMVFPQMFVDMMLPHRLAGDPELMAVLISYLRYGAICQLLLAMVVCLASVLRGMDDLGHPLVTIATNYLGLGVVCSTAMAYLTPLRDLGVWVGIAASLLSSVTFLGMRVINNIK
ncbi:MATE family multidrug resistance protein [Herbaspirillum seropedicae]|uniref:MATE family efflux transporter n=1 Tax=Herbaspirillum seropedicae TaxID=964 RepID=UPI00339882B7